MEMKLTENRFKKWIVLWLSVGVMMVFVQIILGGVTRLTGSGLSITRWDIVTGTIPPLNHSEWEDAFDLYKLTPQYKQINEGMDLSRFKFIFFWEYIHRLWARTMGFVFLIPFLYFIWKGALKKDLLRRLGVVVCLAACAALFGWIMVASGLIERPWVNAYKLTVHLGLGIFLFIYLFYTRLAEKEISYLPVSTEWRRGISGLIVLVIIQVIFGGMVSGMKSALNYPTWPMLNGHWIPLVLYDSSHWNLGSVLLYDKSGFMSALVQFIHRNLAYSIAILIVVFAFRWMRSQPLQVHWISYGLVGIIVVQILLGILTLLGSRGGAIPVLYGVMHQGVGIILLTFLFYIRIRFSPIVNTYQQTT
jgi:heme a synthase